MTTSASISNFIRRIAGLLFACGVMGLVLWQVVTIYPGSEYKFLVVCGLLLLSGLLRREWHYRIAAIVLVTFCTLVAIDSRARGLAYEQRVMARKAAHAQSH